MSPTICPQCGSTNTSPATLAQINCRDCQTTFGGDHQELVATTRQIVLNTYQQGAASQNLTFTKTAAGATIEGPFLCYYPDLPEIYINQQQWQQLLADFFKLYVRNWKAEYYDDTALEPGNNAFGWDLKIIIANQEPLIYKGQNRYPPYWSDLMELFTSLGLPNIGKALGQNFLQLQAQSH
ncbi:hypothetical protein GH811_07180 [Acetobacterium malicum]|uniref:Uncharacterized protein n=1 Tax=Acetobacterium malicum TaxID=52692 RepID=A0ABR6YWB1_9FIRM|nr:hypothetical protein [Acetobacterium malicum]MBC3899395.1 hypothetical protein [Acetobacterium malicum]